jgi:DNA replication protein DnaC
MDPAPCPFGRCDGSGLLVDEDTNTARPCSCRAQRIARAKASSLSAVIPKRYRNMSFDRPPIANLPHPVTFAARQYITGLGENLRTGRGLWIFGEVGTGKTSLAMLVSQAALEAGHTVAIYSMPTLLRQIRSTYGDDSETTDVALLERLATVDLLHLDDVGAERMTPWVAELLYSLVNARYEEEKAILLTTNIRELDELGDQIGKRTTSRLVEMCEQIPLLGSDHRIPA